ncbi:ATP synthase F0 subunit C [candidate division KSB1 bacterium]|nr:ATP synthase F0 subunit C [candidate division KSB1 bacterium]
MWERAIAFLAAGIGAIGAVWAGAYGISVIAKSSMENIARQPESANDIRGVVVITAAMIEGIALLALIIYFLLVFK